ncbi:MAG TPA: type II secretion system F family protein [Planctomycetota bacterium]|nr:type II secretion system F family protein [Planctomycetota bacterium]
MPIYTYKAKKAGGGTVTGTLNAQNDSDAVGELRRQGLTVVALTADKKGGGKGATPGEKAKKRPGKARVKSQEMVVFTRQLSTMISSGIPLVEAIEILAEQTSNPGFAGCLEDIAANVRAGKDLSQALGMHPKIFPDIYVNMIRAGEASGQLDIVLSRLADYQEASARLKAEIKSAMTYPIVSLVMVLGITVFLLIFIIPKFEEMFKSMNVDLPAVTKGLLATSLFLKSYLVYWSAGVVVAGILIFQYSRTERGQYFRDWLFLRMPIFGPLFLKVAISRFSRTFATLIQSGVPILGALDIVAQTCGNKLISAAILTASESVRQGETLGEPLAKSKLFPPMVTRMISIGEKTGALESLLEKIADFYDQQVKSTVEALTSLIEPLMIGVMGFLVGGMVMAIFLPIFKMVGALSGKGK